MPRQFVERFFHRADESMRRPNLVVHQVPIHIGAVSVIEKVLVDYLDKASAYRNWQSSSEIKEQVSPGLLCMPKGLHKTHVDKESLSSKLQSRAIQRIKFRNFTVVFAKI